MCAMKNRWLAVVGVVVLGSMLVVWAAPPRPARRSPRPKPAVRKPVPKHVVRPPVAHPPVNKVRLTRLTPVIYTGGGTITEKETIILQEGGGSTEASPQKTTDTSSGSAATAQTDSPSDADQSFTDSVAYKIVGLEDGGMTVVLDVDGQQSKIRMLGVAPIQPPSLTADNENRPALPARRNVRSDRPAMTQLFLDNMLRGEKVYVVYDEKVEDEDESGNYVAYLYRVPDGLLVNIEVVRQGFAAADTRYDYTEKKSFVYYMNKARSLKKGLWRWNKTSEGTSHGTRPNVKATSLKPEGTSTK